MTKKILLLSLYFLSASTFSFAVEQVITLKDGSQIKGELAGVENGVYTVKTPIIGDVHVNAKDVVNISAGGSIAHAVLPAANTTTPPPSADMNQQIQAKQQQLMNNPQAMADLQQLMQDPEIVQLLSDPELVRAVTSRDMTAIQGNPKAQALINNPKMRALMEKMQGASK